MKRTIFNLAVATTLMAGTILTGCETLTHKKENADAKIEDAKQNVTDAQQTVNEAEWTTFKSDAAERIKNNNARITELKEKMAKPGKTLDAMREKRIDALEQNNKDLEARISSYEQNQTDWETFKTQFNHDMDDLGKSLDDITADKK